jgi:hypothetical protein
MEAGPPNIKWKKICFFLCKRAFMSKLGANAAR